MHFTALCLAILGSSSLVAAQAGQNTSTPVKVRWVGDTPTYNTGATFGLPWPRGKYQASSVSFTGSAESESIDLQSWVTAQWPDGSIKWTGHAIGAAEAIHDEYTISASGQNASAASFRRRQSTSKPAVTVVDSDDTVTVDTGKIAVSFSKSGSVLVSTIKTFSGQTVGQNGVLVLRSQSGIVDSDDVDPSTIEHLRFESKINETTVDQEGPVRTLVTIRGNHQIKEGSGSGSSSGTHDAWLPFVVRFYLYADSDAVRAVHSLVYDGKAEDDFISGIGIQFDVPLDGEELYDRHIRLAGTEGGILHEAVRGITGLRRDPGADVRTAQFEGQKLPDESTWPTTVNARLQWIPAWNDYRLTQLSSDGFTLKKRTKAGQSWVNIPGGTRAGGLAYLGGATKGGLAVGLRDFWKHFPTGLDISNAATDTGRITVWLYSPDAQPQDLRPYHDGLGEDTYEKQLDALEITYEDYEGEYNTPYGIARTHEVFFFAYNATPSADTLSSATRHLNEPPALFTEPEYIRDTKALGSYWNLPDTSSDSAATIEEHLDFLVKYYEGQIEQRRWYGFWDYGDFMHTYDEDRHQWRYDVGGYAWDNSELSPDLFFWNYFLRTGRADVYRFAEALTRHTGEVDVYHIGPYKGLGTRHGIQHWGDSAKQIRISTPIYRRIFYYVSGGDERVGDLVHEVLDAEEAFVVVDPRRKVRDPDEVYIPDPEALLVSIGIDWSGLAASWLLEWERRGPRWEEARDKILKSTAGIANLTNGFVTGEAFYNSSSGDINPGPTDLNNTGDVIVSHLSASFGVLEVIDQLVEHLGDETPEGFEAAWLDYCYYYGAGAAEQTARYGVSFGNLNLKQGHSRLTAYAANKLGNSTLAARAWNEYFNSDGLAPTAAWASVPVNGSDVLAPVDEAAWLATNDAALYGLAGIENLALARDALT